MIKVTFALYKTHLDEYESYTSEERLKERLKAYDDICYEDKY